MNTMQVLLGRVGRSTVLTALVAFVGLALLSTAWALTTPLSASPDEPAHIIKAAAVVRGEPIGELTARSGFTTVTVPSFVGNAWGWTCTAYHPETTADCQAIHGDATPRSAETSAGLYNPTYYTLVGWPSLIFSTPHAAVYSMRIVSALICSFFFAVAFTALMLLGRTFFAGLAFLALATPTTVFLSGSVNPNALEIASGSALLALLLLLLCGPPIARPGPALALIAISGVLLANLRALSPLWMAMIAVIALIAASRGRIRGLFATRAAWVTLAVLAVGTGVGLWWTFFTNTLGNMGQFQGQGISPTHAFVTMVLDKSPDIGLIALFGWLDTTGPSIVYALWSFLVLAVLLTAVIVARGRMLVTVLVSVACFFLIPALVQAASIRTTGYIWQARYSLIAYACVLIVSAVAIATSDIRVGDAVRSFGTRAVLTLGGVVAVGQAYTLTWALRRYAVGASGWWGDLLRRPRWEPYGSIYLWILISLVGAALIAVAWLARSAQPWEQQAVERRPEPRRPREHQAEQLPE